MQKDASAAMAAGVEFMHASCDPRGLNLTMTADFLEVIEGGGWNPYVQTFFFPALHIFSVNVHESLGEPHHGTI